MVSCKTIVAKTKNGLWFGSDYNMNIYRGCCHGCIYCDSRSDCYRDPDFDTVKAKENALQVIETDLLRLRRKGVVATGAMSDPYNPLERELGLTSGALRLLLRHGFGVSITTKSPDVASDADILQGISERAPVIVKVTVTAADDALCRKIERNIAPSSERYKAINALSKRGIYCGVLLMPLLPYITDNEKNMIEIVCAAKDNGARFVFPSFGVTLRGNQRQYFFDRLDESFPEMKGKYIKRFGSSYFCPSPECDKLYAAFAAACEKSGLLYRMTDIIDGYKTERISQLNFFN